MTTFASNTLALGPDFISADRLASAGLVVVLLVVFAESGLLVGFFLPGDSLLFTMGLLISRDEVSTPLWLACVLIAVAAIVGDQVGYLFGKKVGPALFRRPDSRLFKQEYVTQASEFFEKYGPRSIVLARFVPIVRTFTPVIAGVSQMNYRQFVTFNIVGGILWGCGVTTLGFYLGKIEFIRKNVEAMLILIVLVSVIPIIVEFLRARRKKAAKAAESGAAAAEYDGTADFEPLAQPEVQPQVVPAYDASAAGYEHQRAGYGGSGHGAPGYGDAGSSGYGGSGYGSAGYREAGYGDSSYRDSSYGGGGYGDGGYGDGGYGDSGYRNAGPGYGDAGYRGAGYRDPGYRDAGYGGSGYGGGAGYPAGPAGPGGDWGHGAGAPGEPGGHGHAFPPHGSAPADPSSPPAGGAASQRPSAGGRRGGRHRQR